MQLRPLQPFRSEIIHKSEPIYLPSPPPIIKEGERKKNTTKREMGKMAEKEKEEEEEEEGSKCLKLLQSEEEENSNNFFLVEDGMASGVAAPLLIPCLPCPVHHQAPPTLSLSLSLSLFLLFSLFLVPFGSPCRLMPVFTTGVRMFRFHFISPLFLIRFGLAPKCEK